VILETLQTRPHPTILLSTMPAKPMTKDAASRIQSSEAKKGGGQVSSGSFASRTQVIELLQVEILRIITIQLTVGGRQETKPGRWAVKAKLNHLELI
jgi:hypothetical protein